METSGKYSPRTKDMSKLDLACQKWQEASNLYQTQHNSALPSNVRLEARTRRIALFKEALALVGNDELLAELHKRKIITFAPGFDLKGTKTCQE